MSSELPGLKILNGEYAIHRLPPGVAIPTVPAAAELSCVIRTNEETTIVCPATAGLEADLTSSHWSAIKVDGPLDFALTGILAGISDVLAQAEVSIFAISTWDTDYVMVKTEKLDTAVEALKSAGYVLEHL